MSKLNMSYTINKTIKCTLNPEHFGKLPESTEIEAPEFDNDYIVKSIKLYTKYVKFHNAVCNILNARSILQPEIMQLLCDEIHTVTDNAFLKWLQLKISDDEQKMLSLVGTEITPSNDCIIEYYVSNMEHREKINHCVENGHLNVLKWFVATEATNGKVDTENAFIDSCYTGHIEMAKWLFSWDIVRRNVINNRLFETCCMLKHFDIATWLLSLESTHICIDIHTSSMSLFLRCCHNGELDVLKWLLSLQETYGKFNLGMWLVLGLRTICECPYGNLEMFQYVLSLESSYGMIDIHANNEELFCSACSHGKLDIAQYLLTLEATRGKFDIHVNDDYIFKMVCVQNRLDVAKWLVSLESTHGKIDLTKDNENAPSFFETCCKWGSLEMAQWLLFQEPTYGVNFDLLIDQRYCCDVIVLEWLKSLRNTPGVQTSSIQKDVTILNKQEPMIFTAA